MSAGPIEPTAPVPVAMLPVPAPIFDEFPPQLKGLPQWVCWRLEHKLSGKKPTKVPYTPAPNGTKTLGHASATDPATWRTLSDCEKAVTSGTTDGVGFVFTENDPYAGIDLDGCRDRETGTLNAWAHGLVEHAVTLGLYIEVSVSGTGLHIIGRGRWGDGRRAGGVEVYDRERYFTMSGDRTGYADGSVEADAQPLLDHIRTTLLHDEPGIETTDAEVRRRRDGLAITQSARGLAAVDVQVWKDEFLHRAGQEARGWWFTTDVEGRSEDRQRLLWRIAADRITNGTAESAAKVEIEVAAVVMRSERYAAEATRGKWPRLLSIEIGKAVASAWGQKARSRNVVIELLTPADRREAPMGAAPAVPVPAETAQDALDGAGGIRMDSEWSEPPQAPPALLAQGEKAVADAATATAPQPDPHSQHPLKAARPKPLNGPWSLPTEALRLGYPKPPSGPIEDAVEWVTANAVKEQPMLSMLATLVGFAAACGSQYLLADGSRLNLYGIGVAPTAAGKDAPRMAALELAREAGIPPIADIGSGQGLEDALIVRQSVFAVIDEIGHFVRVVEGVKAPSYLVSASRLLLTMWTAGKGQYHRRALSLNSPQSQTVEKSVAYPTLSLLGFATPTTLGQGLTSAAIESGLLGRMLFVSGEEQPNTKFMPPRRPIPESVELRLHEIHETRQQHKLKNGCLINFESDAEELAERIMRDRERERFSLEPHAAAIVARGSEKVVRIAGVLAVVDSPGQPRITVEHVRWADAFVRASDRAVIEFVSGRVHDSESMENIAKVRRTLSAALNGKYKVRGSSEAAVLKEGRVPRSLLVRASKLDSRTVQAAIDHLVMAEEVVREAVESRHPNGAAILAEAYSLT